jgi:hypothetical protein
LPETEDSRSERGLTSYALACRRAGEPLVQCGRTWWREVGPCFFRPLLPFLGLPYGRVGLPSRSAFGGCQYPSCAGGDPPNSYLAYLAFTDVQDYCLDHLRRGDRWEVRSAEKRLVIRPLSNSAEFKARAHPVYLEFQGRTKYRYLQSRVRKPEFDRWVDAEFADPGLVALGAWAGDSLVAVSLSRVVGEAWVYSSMFTSNDALRSHAASLMLHRVRCLAAAVDGVTMVFAGMRKPRAAGASVDAFYLQRGATIVRRSAVLRVNPLARWLLTRFRPELWRQLQGNHDAAGGVRDPGREPPS